MRPLIGVVVAAVLLAGCGGGSGRVPAPGKRARGRGIPSSLLAGARTIGRGPRFVPPVSGPVGAPCRSRLGLRVAAHVELFAANHVLLLAAGVGTQPPRVQSAGRIVRARCFGPVVTLDPTGVVLVPPGPPPAISALFRAWGEPLSGDRLASFHGRVRVYVSGRRWRGPAASVPLSSGGEIVLEVGPYVPPHRAYTFPPAPPSTMR